MNSGVSCYIFGNFEKITKIILFLILITNYESMIYFLYTKIL